MTFTKAQLRETMLQQRLKLSPEEAHTLGQAVQKRVLSSVVWTGAKERIALYAAVKNEVDTTHLMMMALEKGVAVYFPRVEQGLKFYEINEPADLEKGAWGVLEPKHHCRPLGDKEPLDVIFVPAIAFDKRGHRLGYGKGFYDSVIQIHPSPMVGLAYDFQVIDMIPNDSWDRQVNRIITEKKEYAIG